MPFQFQSWEFLFASNVLLVLIFPWLLRPARFEYRILLGLFFLPYLLALIEHLFFKADLEFHLRLTFLHWDLSLLSLYAAWKLLLPRPRRILYFYILIFVSLLFSLLKFVYSPSLVFVDPFWGVVPGTVSIDPIISLEPYIFRAGILALTAVLITSVRSASGGLLCFFFLATLMGFATPSPWVVSKTLEKNFQSSAKSEAIEVFVENSGASSFEASIWLREFSFIFDEIRGRLPPFAKFNKPPHFRIFLYASDDSKAQWLSARQTQIGNFVNGSMHLSHATLGSNLLIHELAHLVHGSLRVSLSSFIDPFYLEGLAVALASPTQSEALDEGAAFVQVLKLDQWPRGLSFLSSLPPTASYSLAGAYATTALQEGRWPWNASSDPKNYSDPLTALRSRSVDPKQVEWATKALERKPLFKDPHRRDCARLEWNYAKDPSAEAQAKLSGICPNWQKSPAYSVPVPDLEILERSLGRIVDEKLRTAEQKFYFGLLHKDSKTLAKEILADWSAADTPESAFFKRRLLWELAN